MKTHHNPAASIWIKPVDRSSRDVSTISNTTTSIRQLSMLTVFFSSIAPSMYSLRGGRLIQDSFLLLLLLLLSIDPSLSEVGIHLNISRCLMVNKKKSNCQTRTLFNLFVSHTHTDTYTHTHTHTHEHSENRYSHVCYVLRARLRTEQQKN